MCRSDFALHKYTFFLDKIQKNDIMILSHKQNIMESDYFCIGIVYPFVPHFFVLYSFIG